MAASVWLLRYDIAAAEAPVMPLDLGELRDDLQLARRWGQKIWPA